MTDITLTPRVVPAQEGAFMTAENHQLTKPGETLSASTDVTASEKRKSLMIIAGDVSADKHMGKVIKHLRAASPDLDIWAGIGGDCMKEAGVELLYHLRDTNVFGLLEALRVMSKIVEKRNGIVEAILKRRPDVILLVDYGAFNLRIARQIRKKLPDQKIVYFIAPQLWASRPWRIKTVADNISKVLVIFPFEEPHYKKHGIDARFIGHPLPHQVPNENELMSREAFARTYGLDPGKPIIAVLPGSRKQEIREHLHIVLAAAQELHAARPDLQFVISKANADLSPVFDKICASSKLDEGLKRNLAFIEGKENYNLLKNSDIVWAKSGTTTLEVAMFAKPMIIFYHGDWLSYFVIEIIKTVKNVGMPNILAGKKLVPELLQLDCRPQQFVRYTRDLLEVPGLRQEISAELSELRRQLGETDYVYNCASEVLKVLEIPQANQETRIEC